ncbi:hypothetical protein FH609_027450 [Streptomyces sp. 3MP-14]|uniref:Uncharacterized protein n=1 Tax=Streptomyces mimosae TaxID=2586635 RepID=A0A5N5ZXM6_9ACTN|nr:MULTISPECIES: hypothetical protein [Streptomyces]KAB8161281.1 hypothetical protein FH607_025945 [Streptomyces mimosae]KAB8173083.1 hypothetical protein FH609_027450 [Streptomyces sp. 3MP-14]
MTGVRVRRADGTLWVGRAPAHPEWTGLVEAEGAVLTWDVPAGQRLPSAEVHHGERAADWLWQVYGPAADALLAVPDGTETDVELPAGGGPLAEPLARLARLGWLAAWWPASQLAGVPALSAALLAAEAAVVAADVEGLLDEPDAVERLLARAAPAVHPLAALADDPELGDAARALAERLAEVAEDFGVELPEPAALPADAGGWALAAGGEPPGGVTALSGVGPLNWRRLPPGVVDAAAELRWTLVRREGRLLLDVAVARAPSAFAEEAQGAALRARSDADAVEFPLEVTAGGAEFGGAAELPPTALLVPAPRRTVTVWAPGYAGPDDAEPALEAAELAARQEPVLAHAERQLDAGEGSFAERVAALVDPEV